MSNEISHRGARMSKNQKESLISFLEQNKVLLRQKLNPCELDKVKNLWCKLAEELNSLQGAKKNVQQWKDALNEFKTNTRRKARLLQEEKNGTGGGPKKNKDLTPIEERLLGLKALLGHFTRAENIPEAGVSTESLIGGTSGFRNEQDNITEYENFLNITEEISHPREISANTENIQIDSFQGTTRKRKRRKGVEDIAKNHEDCLKKLEASNNYLALACTDLSAAIRSLCKRKRQTSAVLNLRF